MENDIDHYGGGENQLLLAADTASVRYVPVKVFGQGRGYIALSGAGSDTRFADKIRGMGILWHTHTTIF